MEWIKKQPKEEYFEFDDIQTKLACINGIEDLDEWLTPTENSLYDPLLLDNIEIACERIIKAIDKDETIAIFLDCDADGLTSGTIMYRYLNHFTNNLRVIYIQREDGHGIENAMKQVTDNIDLLIIVDSSTNSIDACKQIKEKGIDIIVLDHHPVEVENPHVILVNNQNCNYPNKQLSGAGVVFKTIQVLDNLLLEDYSKQYIDLAGLGIYGDVMSVTEPENRYIIYQSLRNIKNLGLKALLKVSGIFTSINSDTFGFTIVPLINASARMGKIEKIIELLLCNDESKCNELAKECKAINEERKKIQAELFESVKDKINPDEKIIILVLKDGNKGFNGLLATQISTTFNRPCLVVKNDKGFCQGSGRSYGEFDLKDFLEKSGLFSEVQGHSGSFGVKFKLNNLQQIHRYINDNYNYVKSDKMEYDLELDANEITQEFIEDVQKFNLITGRNFKPVKFLVKNYLIKESKIIGKKYDTLKLIEVNELIGMKFRLNEPLEIEPNTVIDIVGTLNINKWWHRGKKEWQLNNQIFIEDFKEVHDYNII